MPQKTMTKIKKKKNDFLRNKKENATLKENTSYN